MVPSAVLGYSLLAGSPSAAFAGAGGISGTVVEAASHTPIQGVEACAATLSPTEEGGGEGEFGCAQTNAAGEYAISGLNTGSYAVFFFVPLTASLNFVAQYYDGKVSGSEPTPVHVAEGVVTPDVGAELEPGAELSGTVSVAGTGAPLEGALVCAIRPLATEEPEVVACTKSGAAGAFTLAGVPAGSFYLYFFYAGHEEVGFGFLGGGHSLSEAIPISVAAREVRTGLVESLSLTHRPVGEPSHGGEEPAPGGPPGAPGGGPTGGGTGLAHGLSLTAARIAVGSGDEAYVAVACSGSAPCHGRIALMERSTVRRNGRSTSRLVSLGATGYSLKAGARKILKVRLDAFARRQLRAHRWRLACRLSIVQSSPAPAGASVKDVVLAARRRPAAVRRSSRLRRRTIGRPPAAARRDDPP